MSYKASPRPRFDGPAAIPYRSVTRHLWGDAEAGEVADWIYVSSEEIHQLVFGLAPGGAFRHSEAYRTVFAADEVLYVLSGTMIIANPETGEVHRVEKGEAAFFRRDTWHHAFAHGAQPLRVLEFFSPPPAKGTSGAYARTQPYLETARYERSALLGRWPMAAAEASGQATIRVLRDADLLWRLDDAERPVLTGLYASTEHLTVGRTELLPGQASAAERHAGAESLYVRDGVVNVRLSEPDAEGRSWFELEPGDGFYLPAGVEHRYYNMTGAPAAFMFGVAPDYRPPAAADGG